MNKRTLTILMVIGLAVLAGAFLFNNYNNSGPQLSGSEGTQTPELTDNTDTSEVRQRDRVVAEIPQEIVANFIESFIRSAPPTSNAQALADASSLLSDDVKMGMPTELTSGDLARFVGVQDIPDNGFEMGDVTYSDNTAEVQTTFKYSGGDTVKVFQLSIIDGLWKIDGVR